MKVQIVSDLHFEFGAIHLLDRLKQCDSDVIVIAGDMHTSMGIISALKQVYKSIQKHIVMIPGNHEYYHSTKQHIDQKLYDEFNDHTHIHVLNNAVWEHEDVVFVGSTAWWCQSPSNIAIQNMSDFSVIHDIIPAHYGVDWGKDSYEFFNKELKKYDPRVSGKKVVCVSHNAPTSLSIDEEFIGNPLNSCFASTWCAHMILSYRPDFWIHGHMHKSKTYKFDDTVVISNPYGYAGHCINKSFDPCKIIEM